MLPSIKVLYSSFVLVVIWQTIAVAGYPSPDFGDFFKGSWIDRLPSFEVKLGATGVSVSTGQSREELIWTICYAVAGGVAVILAIIGICFCTYKLWSRRDSSGRNVFVREVPMSPMMMGMGVNPYLGNSGVNNPLINPAILNSRFSDHSSPGGVMGSSAPFIDESRNKPASFLKGHRSRNLDKSKFEPCNGITSRPKESPPPPYRGTR